MTAPTWRGLAVDIRELAGQAADNAADVTATDPDAAARWHQVSASLYRSAMTCEGRAARVAVEERSS